MGYHGTTCQIDPTVRTWNAPPNTLPLSVPLSCAPLTECLLWHPCANSPRMTGYGLGLFYIFHQADPYEDSNEEIDLPLDSFRVRQSNNSIICIKHAHKPSYRHP